MYADNARDPRDNMYGNRAVYCPGVPVIKDDDGEAVPRHAVSFVVCPAPNYGARRCSVARAEAALHERIHLLLAVAAHHAASTLVLGAFGCGVFGTPPEMVAKAFAAALAGPFAGVFERVVFAIPDPALLALFERALS